MAGPSRVPAGAGGDSPLGCPFGHPGSLWQMPAAARWYSITFRALSVVRSNCHLDPRNLSWSDSFEVRALQADAPDVLSRHGEAAIQDSLVGQ
jgi:hypothetical protein